MSRRSQAHAIREVREVPVGNGNRTVKIAVYTPQTLQQRDLEKYKQMHTPEGSRPKLVK